MREEEEIGTSGQVDKREGLRVSGRKIRRETETQRKRNEKEILK